MIGPILKGEKIILKPIKVSEASNYLRWLSDSQVTRFLTTNAKGLNLKKEKNYIKGARKSQIFMNWGIYTKVGRHVGSTGLKNIDLKKNKKATWGIFIGEKDEWGKGYATDTLKTILKFAFNELKLNRVQLSVFKGNIYAKKCYTRCGFNKEGVKRQAIKIDGKFIDEIIMGILRDDYKNI